MKILISALALAGFALAAFGNPIGILLFALAACLCAPQAKLSFNAFPNNCSGRLIDVSPSTGCTLSKAVIRPWTTDRLEEMDLVEVGYDAEYGRLKEARLAGYRENTLAELVNSKVKGIKNLIQRRPFQGNKSIVFPWVQLMQRRNINIQYFRVISGTANANAGVGGTHPGAWDLVIGNQSGAFGTNLPNIKNYFLPGRVLFVDYSASGTNSAVAVQYVILGASAIGAGTTCTVTVAPNVTSDGWAALTAGEKLPYQIGGAGGGNAEANTGCYIGANSVSDYESYKEKDTAVNNLSVIHFAKQTSRIVWDYTDEWMKILANPNMGTYFKKYHQLDEAEQRRQHQALFEKANLHSVFFGQRESEMQDPLDETKWRQLPTAVDPANSNCVLEYKTRAEGIQQQLINCSRYIDVAGGSINLSTLFNNHYLLCRAREADTNAEVDTTDWLTDHERAGAFEKLMMAFYQAYYNNSTTVFIKAGDAVNPDMNAIMGFKQYPVPIEFGGGYINVFHHKFFADRARAFGGANVHRYFMAIDWDDFAMGILETNQRMTQTNEQDEIYRYVLKVNKLHTMQQSITWAPMLQDPNRHTMFRNFAGFTDDITPAM